MGNLKDVAVKGVSWSIVGRLGNQSLTFVLGLVLIRLLSPREFGLVAMVVIFTGFAKIFQNVGLGAALVQYQDVTEKHRSSVFWINLGSGLLLTGLFISLSPLIASFYKEPILVPITTILSFQFFFGGLSAVHRKLFQKNIDFKSLSLVRIGSTIIGGGIAIAMAVLGYGVWSLVIRNLVNSASAALILWVGSTWKPRFLISWNALKDLWGFSLNLLGNRSLNFWIRRLDDILIGRYLGSEPLGLYSKAYKIMLVPIKSVSRVIGRVMFPTLSSIQDEIERVRRMYLRMTQTIALITFPLTLGLLATVKPFVLAVFGRQWAGMIPLLSVFCVTGLWQSVATLNGNLYLSQGRTDLQFRVSLIMNPFIMTGIIVGLQWGSLGVAIGYTVASLINGYVNFSYAGGLVGLSYSDLIYHLYGVFLCSIFMSFFVYIIGFLIPSTWSYWIYLSIQVPSGFLIYWGLVYTFNVQAYQKLVDILVEQWGRRVETG